MPRFKIGDTVFVEGRRATVVWLSENANEIEAMDEYILEFDDKQRRFVLASYLSDTYAVPDLQNNAKGCK
jgi:hypothetical protein